MPTILITGAAGNAGQAVVRALAARPEYVLRTCDVGPMPKEFDGVGTHLRVDTRTPGDVDAAVGGVDAVIHLAAWHCGHVPPVSDETIYAVNVDGTFNVIQACRRHRVKALVFASSMAWGHWGVYSVSKVIGEELCRMFHTSEHRPTVCLRYHDFVPKPYLAFGNKLFFNGVDRRDVASSTVASLDAALAGRVGFFTTVVHRDLGAPPEVARDFKARGAEWVESKFPGAGVLIKKYGLTLPEQLEQHDLGPAADKLNWRPQVNAFTFLADLARRDAAGEDVTTLWAPGQLPEVGSA